MNDKIDRLRTAVAVAWVVAATVLALAVLGALQPLSQAVLLESFKPEERGRAMGFWGLGIVVAPILGPVVGGWLTENYTWRWVFYINLPFGVICLVLLPVMLEKPKSVWSITGSSTRLPYSTKPSTVMRKTPTA